MQVFPENFRFILGDVHVHPCNSLAVPYDFPIEIPPSPLYKRRGFNWGNLTFSISPSPIDKGASGFSHTVALPKIITVFLLQAVI